LGDEDDMANERHESEREAKYTRAKAWWNQI